MIKVGDKYIVEIEGFFEDGYVKIKEFDANGFNNTYFHPSFIERLQKYSPETSYHCAYQAGKEDAEKANADYVKHKMKDACKQGYEKGLNDAWEAGKKLVMRKKEYPTPCELRKIFNISDEESISSLFERFTAEEVIEKLKAYDEQKKTESEVKVGDEFLVGERSAVVCEVFQGSGFYVIYRDDLDTIYLTMEFVREHSEDIKKTGRHFNIKRLLNVIKGEVN